MGFLKNAITDGLSKGLKEGISKGVNNAVSGAVNSVLAPKAEKWANQAADTIDESVNATQQSVAAVNSALNEASQAEPAKTAPVSGFARLEGSLGAWQKNMENYATELSKNFKECPVCGETVAADLEFCPNCGAKLEKETLAEKHVCPKCGHQNTVGTRCCVKCGEVLPAYKEEVEAERAELAAQKAEEEREAERAKAQAERDAKLNEMKAGANDFKNKAMDAGEELAGKAINAAFGLFNKIKK